MILICCSKERKEDGKAKGELEMSLGAGWKAAGKVENAMEIGNDMWHCGARMVGP